MPNCDIIIPAFNNADQLKHSIPAIAASTVPTPWQIKLFVSDDGSTDDTVAVARQLCQQHRLDHVIIRHQHAGAASNRNQAIRPGNGNIVLLLGADIILRPPALALHLSFHTSNPAAQHAALGMVKWDPRLPPTPFMEWMVHGGQQNDFDAILGQQVVSPEHFMYASHVSLKRSVLPANPFPTVYHSYGWEDLDFGRSISQSISLHVLPDAIGLHRHHYSVSDILKRQEKTGLGLHLYQSRYPTAGLLPPRYNSRFHRILNRILNASGFIALLGWYAEKRGGLRSTPKFFQIITASYFWRGVYNKNRRNLSQK